MHFKTFLFCLVVISGFNLGSCLQCYFCAGSLKSDCAKGKTSSMVVGECRGPQLPSFPFGPHSAFKFDKKQPVCISATALDHHAKLFMRFCDPFSTDEDPCATMEKTGRFKNCKSCTTDKCNSHEEDEVEFDVYKLQK